jgi:hypothetical protein
MPEDARSVSVALPYLTEQEAIAFLKGDPSIPAKPKLAEFALCIPLSHIAAKMYQTRDERFSWQGIRVDKN